MSRFAECAFRGVAAARPASRKRGAVLLAATALALPCAAVAAEPEAARAPAVQGYRIDDWKALSSEALTIRTNDGRRYRATLMGKCIGLKFTDTIAFVTRGERSVDRFAGIMLPDGSRCYFKTFEMISQPGDARPPPRVETPPRTETAPR